MANQDNPGGSDTGKMQGETGGAQLGGGAGQSDMAAPGGSSGSGGYGKAENQAHHQGQQTGPTGHTIGQSRGERFDEEQGGGRDASSVSSDAVAQAGGSDGSFDQLQDDNPLARAADEFLRDQQEHQERGQAEAEAEFERDAES